MTPSLIPGRLALQNDLHALVLAGGSGRRLEEFTRRWFGSALPKQFCRFGASRSLLQQTVDRVAPVAPSSRVTVVVDRSHAERARSQLADYRDLVLVEQPCDRGTAAGVLLPLCDLLVRAPAATVLLVACDHGVADEASFLATVGAARLAVDENPERVVLIGAEPDEATCDYGWIVRSGRGDAVTTPDAVARFVEKPSAELATALFESRRAVWNTMVLVARARVLLWLFALRLPSLAGELVRLVATRGRASNLSRDEYAQLPVANFSADVLGASDGLDVLTLSAAAGWTDLGTEARLLTWLQRHHLSPSAAGFAETG